MDITTQISTSEDFTTDLTESSTISELLTETPEGVSAAINLHNMSINASQQFANESQFVLPVFEAFIVTEILMTALELVIAFVAALKISGWRRNYRNQMLMQMSVARFIKRMFVYVDFLNEKGAIKSTTELHGALLFSQLYIDYVISILVCFFIKHMYDSLIIVIVKISRGSLYKVLTCSWLVPVPLSAIWTYIIVSNLLEKRSTYLLACCIIRWPIMFVSIILYAVVLYRVLRENIRKYARSLTIVTFFLCLTVNFYLLFKDIIELWCLKSFTTVLVSYISGFCLNSLILTLYVILIVLNYNSNRKQNNSYAECSVANVIR